jgi:CSLREA domain-containing protein
MVVTSTAETAADGDGACTLQEAITAANNDIAPYVL